MNGKRHSTTRRTASSGDGTRRFERLAERFRQAPLRPSDPDLRPKGQLLIIGGHEDKEGEKVILRYLAQHVRGGTLVVSAVASEEPERMWREYQRVFRGLGVRHVRKLSVESREEAESPRSLRVLEDATAVFLTGGDQLRITSLLGDTPVYSRLLEIFSDGGIIAGTSAGASVMSETIHLKSTRLNSR